MSPIPRVPPPPATLGVGEVGARRKARFGWVAPGASSDVGPFLFGSDEHVGIVQRVDERVVEAAGRIRACLADADAGNYGRSGSAWASYMDRADVERLLDMVAESV